MGRCEAGSSERAVARTPKRKRTRTMRRAMINSHDNPHLILPLGTQVVALVEVRRGDGTVAYPRGAAGIIVQSPADAWHAYRVRFPDPVEFLPDPVLYTF